MDPHAIDDGRRVSEMLKHGDPSEYRNPILGQVSILPAPGMRRMGMTPRFKRIPCRGRDSYSTYSTARHLERFSSG
jgi:hypothetical protein